MKFILAAASRQHAGVCCILWVVPCVGCGLHLVLHQAYRAKLNASKNSLGCSLMLDHRGVCVVNEVSGTKALARVKNGQFRIAWNGPSSSNSHAHTLSNAFTSPYNNTFALLLRCGGHQPWYSMMSLLLGWMLSNFTHDDSSTKFLWMWLALQSNSSPWWCNQPCAPWQATGWVLKIKNYLVYPPPFLQERDSRTQQIRILVCTVC